MKSNKWPVIIILVIFAIIMTVLINISSMLADKEPISANKFKKIMAAENFRIINATEQFAEQEYVDEVYLALDFEGQFQVEFLTFTDETYAESSFEINKQNFEAYEKDANTQSEVNGENHSNYKLSTDEKFMVISRIENTMVYISTDDLHKDEAKELLDKLGY